MAQQGLEIQPGQCEAEIYDEINQGIDPALVEAIDDLNARGVDVHVQIVESMADEGYDREDGDAYVNGLPVACRWDVDNTLVAFVSDDPTYTDIATWGRQEDFKASHPHAFEEVMDSLVKNLQDGEADTYQADMAKALESLYKQEFPATAPAGGGTSPSDEAAPQPTPVVSQPPKEKDNWVELLPPPLPSAGIGLGLALVAGGIARTVTGLRVSEAAKLYTKNLDQDSEVVTTAFMKIEADPTSPLKMLPDEDAPELRRLEAAVMAGFKDWSNNHQTTEGSVKRQWRRIFPRRRDVEGLYDQYLRQNDAYLADAAAFNAEVILAQEKIDQIADKAAATEAQMASVTASVDGLTAYNVKSLKTDLDQAATQIVQAKELQAKHFAVKPFDLFTFAQEQLTTIQAFVDKLPQFHADLATEVTEAEQRQAERATALKALAKTQAGLEKDFDDSCWQDIDGTLATATAQSEAIAALLTSVGAPAEEFAIGRLLEIDHDLDALDQIEIKFETAEDTIRDRHKLLHQLKDELPGDTDDLLADQEVVEDFVDEHAADIEDDTETDLTAFADKIKRLRGELDKDKPAYLKLSEEYTELQSGLDAVTKKVHAERQEMVDLRADIERLEAEVERAISQAVNYEARHGDVDSQTEADIAALDLPEMPRARSRAALRKAKELFEEALADAKEAYEDAQGDVRREEAERQRIAAERAAERARQARAAAEASRRASQALTSSRTSIASTRHSNSGRGF